MHAALEAFAAAAILIEAGDAERMVVVAVDEGGAVSRALTPAGVDLRSGAVAVLLTARSETSAGGRARARVGAITLRRGIAVSAVAIGGHRSLLPLAAPGVVTEIVGSSPPDVLARVSIEPL
jgi:hypothetical protein